MSSRPSRAASQKGWVWRSGWGRSKRIAVIGPTSPRRERRDGDARELRLARLVRDRALEVDAVLRALVVLAGDRHVGGERLPRPRLLREADLVVPQVADADVVGERLAEQARGE